MLPTGDRDPCLLKKKTHIEKRVCKMAHETCKTAGVMHAIIFADGALEAKCARDSSHRPVFEESMERTKSEPNRPRADERESNSDKHSSYESHLGLKNDIA